MKEKELISIGEAATIMNVSPDTLRRWDKNGKLNPFKSQGGHRLYSKTQVAFYSSNISKLAQGWAFKKEDAKPEYYCSTSAEFEGRLSKMQIELTAVGVSDVELPLIGAVIGEIGINSFDHNIGNWPDIPGIFFGYDANEKVIALADRGQGVLATLKRVKPELKNDAEALGVAFSEVISGRAPESRGNGLKFVREVISKNPMGLIFQSGNALLTLVKDGDDLKIDHPMNDLKGCFALITF